MHRPSWAWRGKVLYTARTKLGMARQVERVGEHAIRTACVIACNRVEWVCGYGATPRTQLHQPTLTMRADVAAPVLCMHGGLDQLQHRYAGVSGCRPFGAAYLQSAPRWLGLQKNCSAPQACRHDTVLHAAAFCVGDRQAEASQRADACWCFGCLVGFDALIYQTAACSLNRRHGSWATESVQFVQCWLLDCGVYQSNSCCAVLADCGVSGSSCFALQAGRTEAKLYEDCCLLG